MARTRTIRVGLREGCGDGEGGGGEYSEREVRRGEGRREGEVWGDEQ